jgi:signal transduction histidine kinase
MPTVRSWLRGHPLQADGLLAVVLFALSAHQAIVGPPQVVAAGRMVTALLAATVVVRRRWPVAAFSAAAAIGAAQLAFGLRTGAPPPVAFLQPTMTDLAIPVLLYTLAASRPRRISIAGLVLCLAGSVVAITRWTPAVTAPPGGVLVAAAGLAGVALTAWVLGDSVAYRYRRAHYAAVEERAARLEAERDAQARIAAAAERARELQDRRARAVDESAARLRRIERDLHDGAQVRLTALAMTLGEIKETLERSAPGDGDRIRLLVGSAHANAKQTLTELRDLARGIHPPALDRGLGPALSSLAETSPVPVELTPGATGSPSPAIEAIAYFCAAELLANVAKHSGATQAAIAVSDGTGRLRMTVTDDGAGGAHLAPGGGLAGLLERVQTVDGHLAVNSPPGGPTTVTIELPRHA